MQPGSGVFHGALTSMGNCLFSQGADDLSLLNESEGGSLPGESPPPYQVGRCSLSAFLCRFHRTSPPCLYDINKT